MNLLHHGSFHKNLLRSMADQALNIKQAVFRTWERNLMKYDEPFMVERNQPEPQERVGFDGHVEHGKSGESSI